MLMSPCIRSSPGLSNPIWLMVTLWCAPVMCGCISSAAWGNPTCFPLSCCRVLCCKLTWFACECMVRLPEPPLSWFTTTLSCPIRKSLLLEASLLASCILCMLGDFPLSSWVSRMLCGTRFGFSLGLLSCLLLCMLWTFLQKSEEPLL